MNNFSHTGKSTASAAHASVRRGTQQGREQIAQEQIAQAKWAKANGRPDMAAECLAEAQAVLS